MENPLSLQCVFHSIRFKVNKVGTQRSPIFFCPFLCCVAEKCYFCNIMAKQQSSVSERQRTNLREPRRYKVYIHNDDFTTMEFVVKILVVVFFKTEAEAQALMLKVHHSDKALVGVYTYDIAVSKVRRATQMARDEGYPLRLTYLPD